MYIPPHVRHMLLCDEVVYDQHRVTIVNLISRLHVDQFPYQLRQLTVYLCLTGGRGTGQMEIVGTHAETGQESFASLSHSLTFHPDPLHVHGVIIRLKEVTFRKPGLY